MHKLTNGKKRFLVVFFVIVLLISSINIMNNQIVYNKIESFDENDNKSLFELCNYLYGTNEYVQIYKYFSLIFQQSDILDFFTSLGLDTEQSTNCITLWTSKYLISSVVVNKDMSNSDFVHVFNIIQDIGSEEAFFSAMKKQIDIDYGVIIDYFELCQLKKFLNSLASSIEEGFDTKMKIECYTFLVSEYSSFGNFETSDKYSRKIEREKYKNTFTEKTGGVK